MTKSFEIMQLLPDGLFISRKQLLKEGFSNHVLDSLVRSGEIEVLARGVYRRPGPPLKWQGVVISLQKMEIDLIPGGLTALALHGLSHYIPLGSEPEIHLYGHSKLPSWISRVCEDVTFIHKGPDLFSGAKGLSSLEVNPDGGVKKHNDPLFRGVTEQPWGTWDWPMTHSTPERAILEILNDVPNEITFEHVDHLFEGLATLSPRRLEKLLHECQSIKIKRLFFWFSERLGHAWFKYLKPESFDLGSGKRMLAKGGRLDKKYLITVPQKMVSEE